MFLLGVLAIVVGVVGLIISSWLTEWVKDRRATRRFLTEWLILYGRSEATPQRRTTKEYAQLYSNQDGRRYSLDNDLIKDEMNGLSITDKGIDFLNPSIRRSVGRGFKRVTKGAREFLGEIKDSIGW